MTQLTVLQKIKELVRQRCVAIEQEKARCVEGNDLSTLRLMSADMDTIFDAVEDAISSWQDLPALSYDEAQEQAMRADSSDGPVADSDEGYTLRRADEPEVFAGGEGS